MPKKEIVLTKNRYFWLAAGVITLFFIVFYYLNYISYRLTWPDDIGLYGNLMYNISHGTGFQCGGYSNCFGNDHFRPIFYLFVPAYWLNQDVFTLFIFSAFATTLTGVVIIRIAERYFNWKVCLVIAAFFLVFPATINMYLHFGGREALFPALFFALALLFYLENKFWPWILSLLLASLCVEYISLIALGFVVHALFQRRTWYWWIGALVVGAGYFYLVTAHIMPGIRGDTRFGGSKFYELSYLGGSQPSSIISYMLHHPLEVLRILFLPHKITFYLQLLWPLIFLPLIGIEFLLIPFSQFLLVLLPQPMFYASIGYHYYLPIVPFLFTAGIVGLHRLQKRFSWQKLKVVQQKAILGVVGVCFAMAAYGFFSNLNDDAEFKTAIHHRDMTLFNYQHRIDPKYTVSAETLFFPRFSAREKISLYPDNSDISNFVIVAPKRGTYFTEPSNKQHLIDLMTSGGYGLLYEGKQGDIILEKGYSQAKNSEYLTSL
jgi:uncharacterized membrane protein